ncbi:WRKY DNA-binding transcription factor 70-like [Cocos nucifera]|uniref:WRKY DNA-binding transcription factor 70-like n=1 Tax=Cocos nucifera TaxID=13894 RepID=A0A8K0I6L1_COCNU|nr:WRKY DNA-binding transcription factor 70-like [Cocos nucifera]
MASPLVKKPSFDRETAIQEVVRGRELAAQLQSLLSVDPRRELVHGLMEEVSQSFTRALSLLKPTGISKAIQESASMEDGSVCSGHQGRRKVYGKKAKTSTPAKGIHGRRSYYRCTHRNDQGCLAAKLVQQKDSNDPPMFVVTYIRQHTCKKSLRTSQLPMDRSPSEPCMLSFGSDWSGSKQVQSLLSSSSSKGKGHVGDDVISPKFDASSSSNYPLTPDLTTRKSWDTTRDMLSGMSFSPNSDGSDKHLLMDPWNLDEGFAFDDSEFFRSLI